MVCQLTEDCWFVRVHEGIPKEWKAWSYMGKQVAQLFNNWNGGMGIGEIVHDETGYRVRRLTIEDWNMAIKERKEVVHMDSEDMFLLDWSAPGEWFIIIAW